MTTDNYKKAGVDIDAATCAVDMMKSAVRATYNENVLADVGSFGGLFGLTNLPANPVLVASTDGVGTKVKLAAELAKEDPTWLHGVGHDIVNHCVNDILVQNARPLFFLDYVATGKLIPEAIAAVVTGIAEACQAAGCALIGGETAEMPGVYVDSALDIVGTVVGLVDRETILPRPESMVAGDVLIGLPSSGPHTNGYTLIRKIIEHEDLHAPFDDMDRTLADALLAPHRCYLPEVAALQAAGVTIRGMAHITGGGWVDNVPRMLPNSLAADIDMDTLLGEETVTPIFTHLIELGDLDLAEAFRIFNMGIGMIMAVPADGTSHALAALPEASVVGQLVARGKDDAPVFLNV